MAGHRPRYENAESLSREEEFSRLIAEKFNCSFQKMPTRYGLDYASVRNGRVVGFCEVKVRTVTFETHETYIISLWKFMSADALTASSGLPCVLAIRWTNAWGYLRMDTLAPRKIFIGGRKDRGDWQDMEPMVEIPMPRFSVTHLQT